MIELAKDQTEPPTATMITRTPKAFALRKLLPSSLDDWYAWAQWGAVFCGALALAIGSRVNARQSVEIVRLRKETAEAQKATEELAEAAEVENDAVA